jgi:phosphoribosylamine--glycine ligase
MKTLVIGSGGREHCLAWKLAASPNVEKVYVTPGNGGTAVMPKGENVPIDAGDIIELSRFAKHERIDLTVVGPETPLVAGIASEFRQKGLNAFGPGFMAAQLEGSKEFAKNFMKQYGVPTADFRIFDNVDAAEGYLQDIDRPMVIKASGLAAGKGVIVSCDRKENLWAIDMIMRRKSFGDAGDTVVIEEQLHGFEASLMAITDGEHYVKLPYSQDHKRQLDNDCGPNTGGMGVFCPSMKITDEIDARITDEILNPTLNGIKKEFQDDFRGMLYIGLMLTEDGPKVLEYNVRFGDPEAQGVLPLCDFDLADVLLKCAKGELTEDIAISEPEKRCLGVVVASDGYPGTYKKGIPCGFLDTIAAKDEFIVFHAGTRRENGRLISSGGRVAAVCYVGDSFAETREKVYGELESHDTSGFFYRRDLAAGLD